MSGGGDLRVNAFWSGFGLAYFQLPRQTRFGKRLLIAVIRVKCRDYEQHSDETDSIWPGALFLWESFHSALAFRCTNALWNFPEIVRRSTAWNIGGGAQLETQTTHFSFAKVTSK